jgi:hypothetical protein
MRTCRVCHQDKGYDLFYGRSTECKVCHLERKRAEYAADPERFKRRVKSYRAANPDKVRETRQKANGTPRSAARSRRANMAKHHISEVEYDEIFISQGERCAICRDVNPGRFWCIDHDHGCCPGEFSCGSCIRGILCWHCNVGLGHFRDNPASLLAAVNYVTGGSAVRDAEASATSGGNRG